VFANLGAYLRALEDRGELVRVKAPVSAELEITEIADRVVKAGGPAILFENVTGKRFPLAINLFGTPERTAFALGVDRLEALAERVEKLLALAPEPGLRGVLGLLPKLGELKGFFPKRVARAPVQEVVHTGETVDLGALPVQTCWPADGGPFITLPQVITRDPETGELNVGMYRMQVLDAKSTAMHWQLHKTGRRHFEKAKALGRRLEVAVALGGDPILTYAATAPLPELPGVFEYNLAGFLRGRPVALTKGVTVDLPVPAEAEFVLEGYVDPAEPPVVEGPFGDHTGFYTQEERYPRFHVTAITHRRGAIYPSTIVGRPPMEDAWLIEASERLFLPAAKVLLPELLDYHMPPAGVAHNWVNVSIRKRYPGQAYKVALGLLGMGQMMFAKMIVVLDGDTSPKPGFPALLKALERMLPGRDTLALRGPIDVLDHASRALGFGGKLIIDGTRKLDAEGGDPPPPQTPEGVSHPEVRRQHAWPGFLGLTVRKEKPGQVRAIAGAVVASASARGLRLLAITDDIVDPADPDQLLWLVLNNLDPERDAWVEAGPYGPVLVLDGTRKFPEEGHARPWPQVIEMDPEIKARVTARWDELGLGGLDFERHHPAS